MRSCLLFLSLFVVDYGGRSALCSALPLSHTSHLLLRLCWHHWRADLLPTGHGQDAPAGAGLWHGQGRRNALHGRRPLPAVRPLHTHTHMYTDIYTHRHTHTHTDTHTHTQSLRRGTACGRGRRQSLIAHVFSPSRLLLLSFPTFAPPPLYRLCSVRSSSTQSLSPSFNAQTAAPPVVHIVWRIPPQPHFFPLPRLSFSLLSTTLAQEGAAAIYKGLKPTLVGVFPEKAIKLGVNDFVRGLLAEENGRRPGPSFLQPARPWPPSSVSPLRPRCATAASRPRLNRIEWRRGASCAWLAVDGEDARAFLSPVFVSA